MLGAGASCRAAVALSERSDARVLAAVDEAGGISLVGCPAQSTRAAMTAVVQELIAYSGRLWRMPTGEFSSLLEKGLGRSVREHFGANVPKGWSDNEFRNGLKQSLDRGHFPVLLLLADVNPDVVEAIVHLKSHNLGVRPFGVALYESSGVEIVVPRVLEIAEAGQPESREPARPAQRPAPPRTPQRSQLSTAYVANFSAPEPSSQSEPRSGPKMPWSDTPSPEAAATKPAATEPQATPAPPPKPVPGARMAWDGAMPGVMAGKRPAPRAPQKPEPTKGQQQPTARRQP